MLLRLFGKESAFKERDFRLYFFGQVVSSVGTWLQSATLGWLVFQLTHSESSVGINGALMVAPAIILAPIAGIVIDRFPTKNVLALTYTLGMVQAGALAILVLVHQPLMWEIYALTAILGTINAFDAPARHTSLAEIVAVENIPSATGLNSSLTNAGMMIGTSLAGIIIWLAGTKVTFVLNALSFIPVILTLLMMKFNYASRKHAKTSLKQILPGLKYVFLENSALRSLLALIFFCMAFAFPYRTLMPAIAKVLFEGNVLTFGILGSMPGLGAVVAGVMVSRYAKRVSFRTFTVFGMVLMGTCLVAFSAIRSIYAAVPILFLAGFGALASTSMLRSKVQMIASRNFLGQVTSFHMMAFLAGIAFGNLAIGQLAQALGLPAAIALCGVALLTLGAYVSRSRQFQKSTP